MWSFLFNISSHVFFWKVKIIKLSSRDCGSGLEGRYQGVFGLVVLKNFGKSVEMYITQFSAQFPGLWNL